MKQPKPITLIILDGWGYAKQTEGNAIQMAHTPTWDSLLATCPHTLIAASGLAVGLPDGQMGNSEVGHLHMGAGRLIEQELTHLNHAVENGDFFKNPALTQAVDKAKKQDKAVHILGLLSPGGVHSALAHIEAMAELAAKRGLDQFYIHALLDGRDTPPKSALASIESMEKKLKALGHGKIASLIGRYYAMDRDTRWPRTQVAYDMLTQGKAEYHTDTAEKGLKMAYANGETDEFVKGVCIHAADKTPVTIKDGDVVIFMNFRADRARQLTHALTEPNFTEFNRAVVPQLGEYVTLTQYAKNIKAQVAYPPTQPKNTFGEVLAKKHLHQLRIAETEKYAHVTYFFNGGREEPFPGEQRKLIPSPRVATYDLQPEMSAPKVADALIAAITDETFDAIVCNFANPDMVGHTGNIEATIKALETIDQCLSKIIKALKSVGGELLITADHGNAEKMFDPITKQPHTAHTSDPTPFIYMGREAKISTQSGALTDIAPTLLYLMNLEKPKEMTGQSLVKLEGK